MRIHQYETNWWLIGYIFGPITAYFLYDILFVSFCTPLESQIFRVFCTYLLDFWTIYGSFGYDRLYLWLNFRSFWLNLDQKRRQEKLIGWRGIGPKLLACIDPSQVKIFGSIYEYTSINITLIYPSIIYLNLL